MSLSCVPVNDTAQLKELTGVGVVEDFYAKFPMKREQSMAGVI